MIIQKDKNTIVMFDRRKCNYVFTSLNDIIYYFSDTISRKTIRETIQTTKNKFIKRSNVSRIENKLQFLKKCEIELVKISRDT
jgi:hypothetical protein